MSGKTLVFYCIMVITLLLCQALFSYSKGEPEIFSNRKIQGHIENHLGTFHACARFSLAETCSGKIFQEQYPHLDGQVIPVLRRSEFKFKRAAQSDIFDEAFIDEEMKADYISRLEKKGWSAITVTVNIFGKQTRSP